MDLRPWKNYPIVIIFLRPEQVLSDTMPDFNDYSLTLYQNCLLLKIGIKCMCVKSLGKQSLGYES